MMKTCNISDALDERAVKLQLVGKRKHEIIEELVELLSRTGAIRDQAAIIEEVLSREELASTGIGSGIAIPHCLAEGVEHTAIAFGRHVHGAKFDAIDYQPVHLFFLMVGKTNEHTVHLRLLSKLSRYLHDEATKERLLTAPDPAAVIEVFRSREG